jgi:hypothetical protein
MPENMTDTEYRAAIFPALPFGPILDEREDWQWDQIHFLFGQATLWAQAYEDAMARFVIEAEQRWNRSEKTPEQIAKMTLGALQKEYCRYCHLAPFHCERLAVALNTRNRLAHSFYRRQMRLLSSLQGRQQVIQELQIAIDRFILERDDMHWNLSLLTGQPPL